MKRIFNYTIGFLFLAATIFSFTALKKSDKTLTDPRSYVDQLMSKMTLEDKIGEMAQLSIDVLSVGEPYNLKEPHEFDPAKLQNILVDHKVGSILNVGGHAYSLEHWEKIHSVIQDYAMNKKESGIPVLYGIDAIHGTNYTLNATLFPQQLAQASTWNTSLAKSCGEITAYETRASGIPWSFSPVLDIGRDPRWPRLWETYGEDVLLARRMGKFFIEGMQGNDVSKKDKVAACMKHFLGYSVTMRGKDRGPAWIPDRQLKEYFIPTFQTAIDQGAKTIMICSGELNGIPVHANSDILIDLLRKDLGFEGIVVTDWEDIGYLVSRHKVAKDFKDAIMMAINAGIDLAMVPMDVNFVPLLRELVKEGKVPQERIDESVRRILLLKKELGLFEKPYHSPKEFPNFGSEKHRLKALQAAEESLILAKNESNILPLSKDKKVLVIGATSNSLNDLNGGWTGTWQGTDAAYNAEGKMTIVQAIQKEIGTDNVIFVEDASKINTSDFDAIIACIGEHPYTEKPGDIDDLDLDPKQVQLIQKLAKLNKPIISVIIEGRPRIIREIEPLAQGILFGFLPGNEGAEAIANVLFGDVNPSGKLPITYPKHANDLVCYDHKGTDLVHRDFSMNGFNPQFEFGHGLSYTTFAYSDLTVETKGETMEVSVTISNTGNRIGKEVVQLYITDKVASVTPSVKRLRGFEKIELANGKSQTVAFTIKKDDLAFVGKQNKWIFESGNFDIMIGDQKKTIHW